MSRCSKKENRGPPFVEIGGKLYLNLAFDLEPYDDDVRERVSNAAVPHVQPRDLMVLRCLNNKETKLVRQYRDDFDVEVWARIVGPGPQRRRSK